MNIWAVLSIAIAVALGGVVFGLLCRRLANRGRPSTKSVLVVVVVGLLAAVGAQLLLHVLMDALRSR